MQLPLLSLSPIPQTPLVMDLNPRQQSGLSTDLINQLHQTLQQEYVSREFYAFYHLYPPEALITIRLGKLDKQALLDWSQKFKEAINQWCCCPRDFEATPSTPSLTTRDSHLHLLVYAFILPSPLHCLCQIMLILALRSSLETADASPLLGSRKYAAQSIFFHTI